jgi:hypothetical protein
MTPSVTAVGASKLTSEEARRIGKASSRIPEFMMQRQGFHQRGGRVTLACRAAVSCCAGGYLHARTGTKSTRFAGSTVCRSIQPGRVIQNEGQWKVFEFTWQMDAILFWDRSNGRWLHGTEFHYRFAAIETARELAEVQSARHAVTDRRITMCNLYSITTTRRPSSRSSA